MQLSNKHDEHAWRKWGKGERSKGQKGRKEGRKERRKEGRTEERRKEGRREGGKEGRRERGKAERRKGGRKEGRKERKKEGGGEEYKTQPWNIKKTIWKIPSGEILFITRTKAPRSGGAAVLRCVFCGKTKFSYKLITCH